MTLFYHGTYSGLLESILENGLLPPREIQSSLNSSLDLCDYYDCDAIYFSEWLYFHYALSRACKNKTDAVIFTITLPNDVNSLIQSGDIKIDEDALFAEYMKQEDLNSHVRGDHIQYYDRVRKLESSLDCLSISSKYKSFRFKGSICPKNITKVELIKSGTKLFEDYLNELSGSSLVRTLTDHLQMGGENIMGRMADKISKANEYISCFRAKYSNDIIDITECRGTTTERNDKLIFLGND